VLLDRFKIDWIKTVAASLAEAMQARVPAKKRFVLERKASAGSQPFDVETMMLLALGGCL